MTRLAVTLTVEELDALVFSAVWRAWESILQKPGRPTLMTIPEVAEELRCSGSTVRRLIATGLLTKVQIGAGCGSARALVASAEVERFLKSRK